MLLKDKTAVIYGGGGSIGGAVARAFGREGARVFLAGRTMPTLEKVAKDIDTSGGTVEIAKVDALDEKAVDKHAETVVEQAGVIDISLNVITHEDVQGTPLVEMDYADFERPVVTALRTNFLTSRAAARQMIKQGSGVILFFGGYGDPAPEFHLGGLQVAFQALDTLRSQLAAELGPHGIRAVTIQTAGIPDSIPEEFAARDEIEKDITDRTMLGRAATLEDVGNVAVFAASDWANSITASSINITCGTEVS